MSKKVAIRLPTEMLNMLLNFAVWNIIVALAQSTETSCHSSAGIEIVDSCPQTVPEWKEAVRRKNCKSISHNCSKFHYHCVINAWMNQTIEVCAPSVHIVGKVCAEFNFGGNRIMRNDYAKCEKCPQAYNSSDAFLYTECFEYVERSKGMDTPQSTTETPNSSTHPYRVLIVLSVTVAAVIVAIVSSLLLFVHRRRIRHQETRTIHVCSSVKNMLFARCSHTCKRGQGYSQDQISENDNLTTAG